MRKARDRYTALADQFRDGIELLEKPEEKRARERDARRIAQAYEKSIQNMITSCRIRQINTRAAESGNVAVKFALTVFFVVVAGGTVLAVVRPAIPQAVMARIMGAADAVVAAPVAKSRAPVADTAAQAPVPSKSAPASSAMPVPNAQPATAPHRVVRAAPVAPAAKRMPRKRHFAKAAGHNGDAGSHFMVKVLQPDGSLKEQSFPTTPSR